MVRITNEIKEQMISMRQSGDTYATICESLGVKKERCIAYLKDIPIDKSNTSAMTKDWELAELEAKKILEKMGFKSIHNLNNICSFPPSWDYLAEKAGEWWLVDVTINGQKSISAKKAVMIDGYAHAILLKEASRWKLIKLTMKVDCTIE
jgi:hypothetical protein